MSSDLAISIFKVETRQTIFAVEESMDTRHIQPRAVGILSLPEQLAREAAVGPVFRYIVQYQATFSTGLFRLSDSIDVVALMIKAPVEAVLDHYQSSSK